MIPGQPAYIKDVSYWLPDIAKTRKLIAQNMGIELTAEDEKILKALLNPILNLYLKV